LVAGRQQCNAGGFLVFVPILTPEKFPSDFLEARVKGITLGTAGINLSSSLAWTKMEPAASSFHPISRPVQGGRFRMVVSG
jgi:hypothetical protein